MPPLLPKFKLSRECRRPNFLRRVILLERLKFRPVVVDLNTWFSHGYPFGAPSGPIAIGSNKPRIAMSDDSGSVSDELAPTWSGWQQQPTAAAIKKSPLAQALDLKKKKQSPKKRNPSRRLQQRTSSPPPLAPPGRRGGVEPNRVKKPDFVDSSSEDELVRGRAASSSSSSVFDLRSVAASLPSAPATAVAAGPTRGKPFPKPITKPAPEVIDLLDSDSDDNDLTPAPPNPWLASGPVPAQFPTPFALSPAQDASLTQFLRLVAKIPRDTPLHLVHDKHMIRVSDTRTLVLGDWLNDEHINGYLSLAQERLGTDTDQVRVFSTFFYSQLLAGGYERVRRWLPRRATEYTRFVVPVNFNNRHWGLAVVDTGNSQDSTVGATVTVYDSLPSVERARKVTAVLSDWVRAERADVVKYGAATDAVSIHVNLAALEKCPRQNDGAACGVFAVAFAVCALARLPVTSAAFDHSMQVDFRRRMCFELIGQGQGRGGNK
ncbi:hypothetical protein BC828DRAFT_374705 [Blastocladiella britannica]|nr:hypothetical protein BC828DRAFT_374705 [Blastocladiella britannica]